MADVKMEAVQFFAPALYDRLQRQAEYEESNRQRLAKHRRDLWLKRNPPDPRQCDLFEGKS